MSRRPAYLLIGFVLALIPGAALADGHGKSQLPGRILLTGDGVELYDPGSGALRGVAERGGEPAFLPSNESFVYIREGGCSPNGDGSCYTEYSVFEKSLSEKDADARGRQVFGWSEFFVRSVDVAPDGRLVFSAKRGPGPGDSLQIYTAARGGDDVRQLTGGHLDNDPVVSPDGGRIAFSRKVAGRAQIFTIPIGGGHPRRLTHDGRRDRLPDWSPDGRRLVFISQPPGHGAFPAREIYAIGAGGGPEHRLTHNRLIEDHPTFSPDGLHIAYLLQGDLWLMGAGGGEPREILEGSGYVGFEGGVDWG